MREWGTAPAALLWNQTRPGHTAPEWTKWLAAACIRCANWNGGVCSIHETYTGAFEVCDLGAPRCGARDIFVPHR